MKNVNFDVTFHRGWGAVHPNFEPRYWNKCPNMFIYRVHRGGLRLYCEVRRQRLLARFVATEQGDDADMNNPDGATGGGGSA